MLFYHNLTKQPCWTPGLQIHVIIQDSQSIFLKKNIAWTSDSLHGAFIRIGKEWTLIFEGMKFKKVLHRIGQHSRVGFQLHTPTPLWRLFSDMNYTMYHPPCSSWFHYQQSDKHDSAPPCLLLTSTSIEVDSGSIHLGSINSFSFIHLSYYRISISQHKIK